MSFDSKLLVGKRASNRIRSRLRWYLVVFAAVLSIPLGILAQHSYEQFQTASLYMIRWSAEHTRKQINAQIRSYLKAEESRPFDDYQFLKVTTSPWSDANGVMLSPLAKNPEGADLPGIIGYFQIDDLGCFSCPLLPVTDVEGVSDEVLRERFKGIDVEKRIKLRNIIRSVLVENEFIAKSRAVPVLEKNIANSDELEEHLQELMDSSGGVQTDNIEPLQLQRADKTHLLVYRNAWAGKAKIVQGFVLNEEEFLNKIIEQSLIDAGFGLSVHLQLFYGDKRLEQLRFDVKEAVGAISRIEARDIEVANLPLYEAALGRPFQNYSLRFSLYELPVSAGAKLVLHLLAAVTAIILVGLAFIYRLGLRQIILNEERLNFVSSVSHELKTPLTSIIMYAEMLREGLVSSDEKRNAYYDFIFFEGERLGRLISNVLRLSKLGKELPDIHMEYMPVTVAIDLIRSKISTVLENNDFELIVEYESDSIKSDDLLIDSDAFVQIAINLVDNAVKFSSEYFSATQPDDVQERKRIKLSFKADKHNVNRLCFCVRDFGPGIPREHSKNIFKIFYRTGDELTRRTQGTGIGLALVKELAGAMDAEVEVNNRNPGAEFSLHLQARRSS
ncbi:MAG: two-component system phosphate regulon sensor histidine kinase PhoR [Flavobacteriales bacterium]|jgi:two-component system phosphate regulon sensor histidine kinase PhoR